MGPIAWRSQLLMMLISNKTSSRGKEKGRISYLYEMAQFQKLSEFVREVLSKFSYYYPHDNQLYYALKKQCVEKKTDLL